MESKAKEKLILALDLPERGEAVAFLKGLDNKLDWVKVGLQLFVRYGPDFVREVADMGYSIFLDLKLHDIPNTVASAVKSLRGYPVGMLTLHASGGSEMLQWANAAREEINPKMHLLAVTVLTSMNDVQLNEVGVSGKAEEQVLRLGKMAVASGIQGLVCSPQELVVLRNALGTRPLMVTPGIRPLGADTNEQKRITTPSDAVRMGASHIVVGRPILKSENPQKTIEAILAEMNC